MKQIDRVVQYVQRYGSISPIEAFYDLGITKLATVISRSIRDGMKWDKQTEQTFNRFGEKVRYMRYRLG